MPDKSFEGFSDERERESMRQKIQTWKIHLFMIITRTLKPHHCNTDRIPLRTELCPDRPPLPCLPPSIVFLPLSSSSLHLIYMLLTCTLFHPRLSQKCCVCVPSFSSPPSLSLLPLPSLTTTLFSLFPVHISSSKKQPNTPKEDPPP